MAIPVGDDYQPYAGIDCACITGEDGFCDECQNAIDNCDCKHDRELDNADRKYELRQEEMRLYAI